MKSLLILRHAEAAPGGVDLDRKLTRKGQAQARTLGTWLRERAINPDRIVSSAAVRARETADAVAAAAGWTTQVSRSKVLYNADCDDLLAYAKDQPLDVTTLLLVAHAPGVADLLKLLTTEQVDLTLVYDAGTLAEVVLDVEDWSKIEPGSGALRLLLPP